MYLIYGNSQYDYELRNIIFGVYDNKEKAIKDLNKLEKIKNNNEFELHIVFYKKNTILEDNLFYLKD